jgi:predicted dehydrogenase
VEPGKSVVVTKTTVRLGFIGAGPWGRNLIRSFDRSPRAVVTAICDRDPEQVSGLARGRTSLSVSTDAGSLLARGDLDAIVIATQAETHVSLALAALEAGCHVFVEKPMALSATDAALLCARARECSRRLMVGHVLLYHPAVDALFACIREGEFGDISRVHARRLSTSRRSRTEGAWWSLGPHDVSLMRRLFGSEPSTIRVRPNGHSAHATLSFTGNRAGTIEVGLHEHSDVRLLLVEGTRRWALFDDRSAGSKLTVFDAPASRTPASDPFAFRPASARAFPTSTEAPLDIEARRFVESILDDRSVPSDGAEGLAVTSILAAGAASLATQGSVICCDSTAEHSRSGDLESLAHRAGSLSVDALL